jgi:general nucleoside transport system ATP-binding protein
MSGPGSEGVRAGLPAPAIELRHVSKRFGGVLANDDVSFAAAAGAIHALVGENGGGKTTAMRIAFGLLAPDRGEVAVGGTSRRLAGPRDAIRLGVGMVHQHFTLVDAMTVAENVVLGAEPGRPWALDRAGASARVAELAGELELRIDPAARVGELPVAARQGVELLKALYREARVLILDEPTAVLAPPEVAALFAVLRRLRLEGSTVVLITHRLAEVLAIADEVTVMRDGRVVAARPARGLDAAELARLIVGREAPPRIAKRPAQPGAPVLAVRGLTVPAVAGAGHVSRAADADNASGAVGGAGAADGTRGTRGAGGRPRLDGVSFDLRAGEILGIAGIEGNGQSELIDAIAGLADPAAGGSSGTLILAGCVDPGAAAGTRAAAAGTRAATAGARAAAAGSAAGGGGGQVDLAGASPRRRRQLGIAHIPEDRHRRGLLLDLDLAENSILGAHQRPPVAVGPLRAWLDRAAIARRAAAILARFEVRPASLGLPARALSGGNQQKLVAGRELSLPPRLLLAAQPTRGVDLRGSELIHRHLVALRDGGCAVLLVSSELEELMTLADRLLVLHRGKVVGELDPARATVEEVGLLMTGGGVGA